MRRMLRDFDCVKEQVGRERQENGKYILKIIQMLFATVAHIVEEQFLISFKILSLQTEH